MKISIIIPVYNEEEVIRNCLASLTRQTIAKEMEIIVVDDGSTDETLDEIRETRSEIQVRRQGVGIKIFRQNHLGPGAARNLGAGQAKGDILVFVDADMEFAPDFVAKLVAPIESDQTIGTYSQEEYLLNKNAPLARCWNLNLGRQADKMEPRDFEKNPHPIYRLLKTLLRKVEKRSIEFPPDQSHVFRAIRRDKFLTVRGFDTRVGYTDDWSLARKLGIMATLALRARYYHRNPETYQEIWRQARWFGKNEFLTGNWLRKLYNLWRYCPALAVFKGIFGAVRFSVPEFFPFKLVYDTAVFTSVLRSFLNEQKFR